MKEHIITAVKGVYRDRLLDAGDRLIYDSGWTANTIVAGCRVLLAGFMKNEAAAGIQFLAVGQGDEDWDSDDSLTPYPADTTDLTARFKSPILVDDLDLEFLNKDDGVAPEPTSRLQITAKLGPGYPTPLQPLNTYPLREFGLFGRFGTPPDDTEYLINAVRHPVIHKDESATLIRVIRLYF